MISAKKIIWKWVYFEYLTSWMYFWCFRFFFFLSRFYFKHSVNIVNLFMKTFLFCFCFTFSKTCYNIKVQYLVFVLFKSVRAISIKIFLDTTIIFCSEGISFYNRIDSINNCTSSIVDASSLFYKNVFFSVLLYGSKL